MSYEIIYSKKSLKQLSKYLKKNPKSYENLLKDIEKLEENPYNPGYKNLKSAKCPRCKRIKSGPYRIVYYVHDKNKIIEIVRVIERKKDYKEF